jgi:uncharacterized protein (TIGR03435 family)
LAAICALTWLGLVSATQINAQLKTPETPAIAPGFKFDVVSIEPSKSGDNKIHMSGPHHDFTVKNFTLLMLIEQAYGIMNAERIAGNPNPLYSERFDIDAKMEASAVDTYQKLSSYQQSRVHERMLQTLMADRFKLKVHRETHELPAYTLVIAENGPKFQEAKPGDTYEFGGAGTMVIGGGTPMPVMKYQGLPIAELAGLLEEELGFPVLDKTGLTGTYNFSLTLPLPSSDELQSPSRSSPDGKLAPPQPNSQGRALIAAIQQQLGLKVESGKGPVEVVVIDHVERPSGN